MKQNLLISVIVIVLLAAAGFGAYRVMQNSEQQNEEPVQTESTQTQNTDQLNNEQTSMEDKTKAEPIAGCTRNFDSNVLKTAKVDLSNKFVTLSVKGFGDIKLELFAKDAPKTVENFLRLVNSGYYDCITFHRVAKGFVIQGGDPTGTGSGGDSAFGGEFADELNPETASYKAGYVKGTLAMANRGPNTNTSQFFIMLGDVDLPKAYTIFGKVSFGVSVVDKIGAVDIVPQLGPTDGKPVEPIVIEKAVISSK